jgi:protein TonB
MKTFILLCFCFFTISTFSQTAEDTTVYQVVEQMPEFPGGDDALLKWLGKNVKYPSTDCHNTSTLPITFIIEKDGSISNVGWMRPVSCQYNFDNILSVVKSMPVWKPGMQNGKPARVRYNIPIRFEIRR